MASRSRGRELAIQVLYQYEYSGYTPERVLELFWRNIKTDIGTRRFCEELVVGVLDCLHELDQEIIAYLKNWTLDRIVSLDHIIMKLAFYELIYAQDVPWRVVVEEAVVLARMYSSEKSVAFINGVLHAWVTKNRVKNQENERAPADTPPAPSDTADDQ